MSAAAIAESATLAVVPERAGLVRALAAAALGDCHPGNGLAVLLASGLVTDSVRHGVSGVLGGLVTVAVVVSGVLGGLVTVAGESSGWE